MLTPRHHYIARRLLLTAGLAMAAVTGTLAAATPAAAVPHLTNRAASEQGVSPTDYWTPERMRDALPLPLPEPDPNATGNADGGMPPAATSASEPGALPSIRIPVESSDASLADDDGEELDDAAAASAEPPSSEPQGRSDVDEPSSSGTAACYFSSSRLNPRTADARYPYCAVGKLFFTEPGVGDFVCSGSVLRPRIVVTAGHCVHSGNGQLSGYYTNFLFCPAYRNKMSPQFGCWSWAYVNTTSDWYNGGGKVPNAADYAMIQVNDRVIGGSLLKIGAVTGYFGYSTVSLSANHVHMLGYPVNLSNGVQMHQVAAGRCVSGGNNTEKYGSDMRGGSSGGPWVQDFGRPSPGQTVSSPAGPDLIVGITSYGSTAMEPLYQGASIPDNRFLDLLNNACAHSAGNC